MATIPTNSQVQIEVIRTKLYVLCQNNYVTLISRKTGLCRSTVSKFFNDQKVSSDNEEKILDAALDLILQKQERQQHREKLIDNLGLTLKRETKA